MKRRLSLLLATSFYIGMIPGAPGTYASIATTIAFFLIYQMSHKIAAELHLSAVCLIALVGVVVADEVSRNECQHDPQHVVIDEVAGQLTTFLFLPVGIVNLLAGTILFRAFDIWKPFPVRKLETLENGVGIMADDLLAGVYANLVLHALHRMMPG